MLPKVKQSSEVYGHTAPGLFATRIKISGIAGDQQAALFGQMCTKKGMVKNTYGTGCFMLMNIGDKPIVSKNNLLTSVAWQINGKTEYVLEGSIFIAGAVVQWLRDSLKIIKTSKEVEQLAGSVEDSGGVYFVPAFAGLGAPHWNQHAQGTIFGLTRGSTDAHIARAALESIAFQTMDILKAMEDDSGLQLHNLRVDGGACANNHLMQFQADILDISVIVPEMAETTALGAAYAAGLAIGYWKNESELQENWKEKKTWNSNMTEEKRKTLYQKWQKAVKRSLDWEE
jgi:glycerol kinase